jgi:hypothetical protein
MERRGVSSGRLPLPYALILLIAVLPPLALALVAVFGSHSVPPGRCEGLGGGCVMSPAKTAQLFLLFVVPAMLLWAALALGALVFLRRRPGFRERPALVQVLPPVVPAVLLVAAFVLT